MPRIDFSSQIPLTLSRASLLALCALCLGAGCEGEKASNGAENLGGGRQTADANCAEGQTECPDGCVVLSSNADNCGACGEGCSDSLVCSRGECSDSCDAGLTQCDRECVDPSQNADHCGACDNTCAAGQTCSDGTCVGADDSGSGGTTSIWDGAPVGSCATPSDWGPDSRDVPQVGEPGFDPSVDPGLHPAFYDDPDLYRCEDYVYVPTQAGDHDLPDGVFAVDYDVTGSDDLRTVLSSHHSELGAGHGLALYLLNGNELNDEDLSFLQTLNQDHTDWSGLSNLNTLHVYNLFSVPAGVRSDNPEHLAYGIPTDLQLFFNGWQSTDSQIMKGTCWVEHIVMDDLKEIPAGAFCDTYFHSMSFKGARFVGELGLGMAPRAPATYLYMPSLEIADKHAFKRRQQIVKYNFPRLRELGDFAIDDSTQAQFINAPSLQLTAERNSLNDPRYLIAFNYPNLEYMGLSCMGGTNETTTVFRFPSVDNFHGSSVRGHSNVRFVWAPEATRIGPNVFIGNAAMTDVYAPKVEWLGRFAFDECVSLTELNLPAVTYVQNSGFEGADSLEVVRLPNAEDIGDRAFADLANLSEVHLGDTPPDQGSDVFVGTSSDLAIFYTGEDSNWAGWTPAGNASAMVTRQ